MRGRLVVITVLVLLCVGLGHAEPVELVWPAFAGIQDPTFLEFDSRENLCRVLVTDNPVFDTLYNDVFQYSHYIAPCDTIIRGTGLIHIGEQGEFVVEAGITGVDIQSTEAPFTGAILTGFGRAFGEGTHREVVQTDTTMLQTPPYGEDVVIQQGVLCGKQITIGSTRYSTEAIDQDFFSIDEGVFSYQDCDDLMPEPTSTRKGGEFQGWSQQKIGDDYPTYQFPLYCQTLKLTVHETTPESVWTEMNNQYTTNDPGARANSEDDDPVIVYGKVGDTPCNPDVENSCTGMVLKARHKILFSQLDTYEIALYDHSGKAGGFSYTLSCSRPDPSEDQELCTSQVITGDWIDSADTSCCFFETAGTVSFEDGTNKVHVCKPETTESGVELESYKWNSDAAIDCSFNGESGKKIEGHDDSLCCTQSSPANNNPYGFDSGLPDPQYPWFCSDSTLTSMEAGDTEQSWLWTGRDWVQCDGTIAASSVPTYVSSICENTGVGFEWKDCDCEYTTNGKIGNCGEKIDGWYCAPGVVEGDHAFWTRDWINDAACTEDEEFVGLCCGPGMYSAETLSDGSSRACYNGVVIYENHEGFSHPTKVYVGVS